MNLRPARAPMSHARSSVSAERSEEHTSELQSRSDLVCRLLLEKKKQHLDVDRHPLVAAHEIHVSLMPPDRPPGALASFSIVNLFDWTHFAEDVRDRDVPSLGVV